MFTACLFVESLGIAAERARLPNLCPDDPIALTEGGAVVVASAEAAASGVAPGMGADAALALCPGLVVLPYDRPAYEEAARPLWDALACLSDTVEPITPELCFAALPDGQEVLDDVRRLAGEVARRVGVPARAGIARTKFAARAAAATGGGGGCLSVPLGEEERLLASLPLAALPRLGRPVDRATRLRLEKLGVRTLGDLLALPPHRLPRGPLRKAGQLLYELAHGRDADPVRPLWPPPTVGEAHRFDEGEEGAADDRARVEAALGELARRVAARLAAEGHGFCREAELLVRLEGGAHLRERERFARAASQPGPLLAAALRLLDRMPVDEPLAEVGLTVGGLGAGGALQLPLLDERGVALPHERRERLEATLAFLRSRFGARAVVSARALARARRIGLWTFPLGHLLDEEVKVATDAAGDPARFWRYARRSGTLRRYDVRAVQDRWRESRWQSGTTAGEVLDRDVWRVETDPWGLSELHRVGLRWRLGASAD